MLPEEKTLTLSRRAWLASAAATVACGRALAPRFDGHLLVSSAAAKGISVTDLSSFRPVGTIPLGQTPGRIVSESGKAFVACPDTPSIAVIDVGQMSLAGKIGAGGRVVDIATVAGAGVLCAIVSHPSACVFLDPATGKVKRRISLPQDPVALSVDTEGAAVLLGKGDALARISNTGDLAVSALGARCGAVRFRADGKMILLASADTKQLITVDRGTGEVLARLPVSIAPRQFCTHWDGGGQVFVTGEGHDEVVILSPYQNQIDQTIPAGRAPFGMAAFTDKPKGRDLLFVTNPPAGDLTVLDVNTRRLAASVHVGGVPDLVLLTPDQTYALVLDRESGHVAVLLVRALLEKVRAKPVFTMFATGSAPQSAVIVASA